MTWTDIADELTPDQIAALLECERDGTDLRPLARRFAAENLLQALYAEVPVPVGAVGVCQPI